MKKIAILGILAGLVAVAVSLSLMLRPETEAAGPPQTNSHSLFLGRPSGAGLYDSSVFCESSKPFIVYIHMSAGGSPANGRVQFQDGDAYGFQLTSELGANATFSTVQAAGGVPGVDRRIEVFPEDAPGQPADSGILSGWMSASSVAGGGAVSCGTTP